jgi:hypothetical protein
LPDYLPVLLFHLRVTAILVQIVPLVNFPGKIFPWALIFTSFAPFPSYLPGSLHMLL